VPDFEAGEECDDGNTGSGDGCSSTCEIEQAASCGDGVLDVPNEECDDGGNVDGDGCSASCQLEQVGADCGDGVDDPGEVCEDGNLNNGDGCNPTCNLETIVTDLGPIPGNTMTSDGTYLYVYNPNSCQIDRVAIATCTPGNCNFAPFVGSGSCPGTPSDGPGASADIGGFIGGMAFGEGQLFFGDSHTIRAVDLGDANLTVTTLAGSANACGEADGTGANAVMADIRGLAYFSGTVYFVDGNMATLRGLDPATGDVMTLAGQTPDDNSGTNYDCGANLCCGGGGPAADGYGTSAIMFSPRYITSDNAGFIYIIDTNGNAIRRYNVATTYMATMVGGNGYNDGVGPAVGMDRPRGITSDGTSVYFAEQNDSTLRQVELATATTSTLVGVRGCTGPANLGGGIGGDGTQDWSGQCGSPSVVNMPQFTTGTTGLVFDYAANAIFAATSNGRLLLIE
jgi:cysteine-rich repeat protein